MRFHRASLFFAVVNPDSLVALNIRVLVTHLSPRENLRSSQCCATRTLDYCDDVSSFARYESNFQEESRMIPVRKKPDQVLAKIYADYRPAYGMTMTKGAETHHF